MKEVIETQYKMIRGSRNVLLDYCDSITPEHFITENGGFGRGGSMRNLLVHNGTTYQYWIGGHALGREMIYPIYDSIVTVKDIRNFYKNIDALVTEFIEHFKDDYNNPISTERDGKIITATPLEVFTHVITHEFHHKGQILSISRQLGYLPVDTDIMR